jgi:hypothetical protein
MKQFLLFTLLLALTASAFEFTGKVVGVKARVGLQSLPSELSDSVGEVCFGPFSRGLIIDGSAFF